MTRSYHRAILLAAAEEAREEKDLDRLQDYMTQAALLGFGGRIVDVPELCSSYIGLTYMQEVIPGRVYFYELARRLYAMSSRMDKTDSGEPWERPGVMALERHPDRERILLDPALLEAVRRLCRDPQPESQLQP